MCRFMSSELSEPGDIVENFLAFHVKDGLAYSLLSKSKTEG